MSQFQPTIRPIHVVIAPATLFTIAWLLTMIAIPIIGWIGEDYFDTGVMLGVLLQCCAVITILQYAWGSKLVIKLAALLLPLTWLLEFIGSQTGFPFGLYHYTQVLQPQIGGVPLIIPLAWLMMLPVSWAVAAALLPQQSTNYRLSFAFVSGIAMTAWDLFLDPQMVGWGYWVWQEPGGYFGIPWVNFLGWWLSSAAITWLILLLIKPTVLPIRPLLVIYALVWALQSVGQALFWSQPGPALVGFVGMGIPLLLIFVRNRTTLSELPTRRVQQ